QYGSACLDFTASGGDKECVVRHRTLVRRAAGRVVVERDRLARDTGGRGERMGMAVKRTVGGGEDDGAIEDWQDAFSARLTIPIPQLEVASVLLFPILVEIDQHVQTTIEFELRMNVEVGVHFEKSARLDLMETAPAEVWIGNHPVDPRERLEPQQHLERVHVVEEVADHVRDAAALV